MTSRSDSTVCDVSFGCPPRTSRSPRPCWGPRHCAAARAPPPPLEPVRGDVGYALRARGAGSSASRRALGERGAVRRIPGRLHVRGRRRDASRGARGVRGALRGRAPGQGRAPPRSAALPPRAAAERPRLGRRRGRGRVHARRAARRGLPVADPMDAPGYAATPAPHPGRPRDGGHPGDPGRVRPSPADPLADRSPAPRGSPGRAARAFQDGQVPRRSQRAPRRARRARDGSRAAAHVAHHVRARPGVPPHGVRARRGRVLQGVPPDEPRDARGDDRARRPRRVPRRDRRRVALGTFRRREK